MNWKPATLALSCLIASSLFVSGCGAGICVLGNIGECPSNSKPFSSVGSVELSVDDSTIGFGQTAQFSVTGGTSPYRYSVSSGSGTIDSDGLYTAPSGTGSTSATIFCSDSRYTGAGDTNTSHYDTLTITISSR